MVLKGNHKEHHLPLAKQSWLSHGMEWQNSLFFPYRYADARGGGAGGNFEGFSSRSICSVGKPKHDVF